MSKNKQKAVIYARVSSVKQVKKGDGLGSQETRCREYAGHKNYQVIESFRDEGVSGSMINRPGMQAMLKFIKKHKQEKLIVIIDDISRLARDLEAHIQRIVVFFIDKSIWQIPAVLQIKLFRNFAQFMLIMRQVYCSHFF